jgi:hypothetical protein
MSGGSWSSWSSAQRTASTSSSMPRPTAAASANHASGGRSADASGTGSVGPAQTEPLPPRGSVRPRGRVLPPKTRLVAPDPGDGLTADKRGSRGSNRPTEVVTAGTRRRASVGHGLRTSRVYDLAGARSHHEVLQGDRRSGRRSRQGGCRARAPVLLISAGPTALSAWPSPTRPPVGSCLTTGGSA